MICLLQVLVYNALSREDTVMTIRTPLQVCSICEAHADWVRVRMPNEEQMTYLCHKHYSWLHDNNSVLAGYYDALGSRAPWDERTPQDQNAVR